MNTAEMKRGSFADRALALEQAHYVARVIRRAQDPAIRWPISIITHKDNPETTKWDRTFTRWVGDIVLDDYGTAITDKLVARWPETYAPY